MQRVIWAEHEPDDSVEFDPYNDMAGYYFDLLEERLTSIRGTTVSAWSCWTSVVSMCGLMALDTRLGRAGASYPTRLTRPSPTPARPAPAVGLPRLAMSASPKHERGARRGGEGVGPEH
jgi:hypothetical protein